MVKFPDKGPKKPLPKILTLDIETFPLESYTWGTIEQNVGLEQIKTEASIASFGAKWLGKRELIYMHTGGRGQKKVRDDSILMAPLWNLLHEADIVVGQNVASFDLKWIRGKLIRYGHTPPAAFQVYDTLSMARRHFRFTSNKLAWQSEYLTDTPKSKHKKFPGFELWLECLADNPVAWAEMRKYNLRDVVATEKLYLRQRAWTGGPNMGAFDLAATTRCVHCGSTNVKADGHKILSVGVYTQYRCEDCGGWSRGRKMLNDKITREAKLA